MEDRVVSAIAADILLVVHVLVAAFVIGGLVLVFAGAVRGWRWVRNPWFRWVHLAAVAVIVLQSWLGLVCPLTTLEMALRVRAGESTYAGAFVVHWLGKLLYYDLPAWVFVVGYTVFGLLVAAAWYWVRPRRGSTLKSPPGRG